MCALCNDFGIEAEGAFHTDGKGRLQHTYKVVCTKERWDGFSSLEQRFRHVVDVNKRKKEKDPERYFISERGLQNKVAGKPDKEDKWIWWTENDTELRDFENARIFVCHACNTPKTGHKRWLMNSDPGKITSHWSLVTYLLELDLDAFVCPCVT